MTTLRSLCRAAAGRLREATIESPETDARILMARAMEIEPGSLLTRIEEAPGADVRARFESMIARRESGEPVARIVGLKEFWSLPLAVGPDVLVPRPETELLVEAALAAKPEHDAPLRILDLGTGSGALLAALLRERPHASGVGVDRSAAALAVARANLQALGVVTRADLIRGDWAAAISARFDVIVANPPYIEDAEIAALPREVRLHDPHLALAGGPDGLDAYRAILAALPELIAPDGVAVLEFGAGQETRLQSMAVARGMIVNDVRVDLAGLPRALVLAVSGAKKTLGGRPEPH